MKTEQIKHEFDAFLSDQRGAVAVEYALLAGLIALAIIGGAAALGGELDAFFSAAAIKLNGIFDVFN